VVKRAAIEEDTATETIKAESHMATTRTALLRKTNLK
jgi:hypothetical protein